MNSYAYPIGAADYATRGGEAAAKSYRRRDKRGKPQADIRRETREEMRLNKDPELKGQYDVRFDLWTVRAKDLCLVFCDWLERRNMNLNEGAIYVASELGCHEDVVRKLSSKEWVSFAFADAFLVVIGRHFSLINGEVPYWANPYMSRKTWETKAKADGIECAAQEWVLYNPAQT